MNCLLSKSKYLIGLQCPKYLWTVFNEPDKIPETDKSTQYRFDQGHLIGELAKKLFPKGIDIPTKPFAENLKKSKELIKLRKPLFEAAFYIDKLYSRADILNPVGKDEWDIIEVKSSTEVKDVNLHDVSFQKYCYQKCGLKIRKCFLMHINKEYVKKGEICPKDLFVIEDITKEVEEVINGIQERIELMFKIITSKKYPTTKIGKICKEPYPCPLEEGCWQFLPKNNVFDLYRGGKKSEELFEKGILAIKDIPKDFELNDKQQIQRECEETGKPHIHKEEIKHFLKTLHYPLYFMDFETFNTAIPMYDGTRPYQQIPFQFSLHVLEKKNSKLKHFSFLASGKEDPRKDFASELKKVIGDKGSVIVFNQTFEMMILRQLAESFPKEKKWIQNVLDRIVDLIVPFRSFHYYHPKQQGSASIKDIMPAIIGKGYEDLDIAKGGDASLAFLDLAFEKIPEKDKEELRKNLEKYCGRDTEGMVWILKELEKLKE